jgi:pyruvate/2-oxoglutarate dehydrogenase complex dihydrolipoamide dehydrogenase (E3) component
LEHVDYLTNASIMELKRAPEHLLVLGGGYIGLEFGQMFRRFGRQVTVIHHSGQILPREDRDVVGRTSEGAGSGGHELSAERADESS